MAFYRSKNPYINEVKINLGTLFGLETDEEAFVTLRELSTMETMRLRQAKDKGELELLEYFHNELPYIITNHNFYEDETTKMTNLNLTELLFEKLDVTTKILSEFSDAVFQSTEEKKGK